MGARTYNIIFEGTAAEGVDPENAKLNLQSLFKTDRSTVDRLFAGKRTVLKRDVSIDVARKYQLALNEAGASFSIEPELPVAAAPSPSDLPPVDAAPAARSPAPANPVGPESGQAVNPYAPPAHNAAVAKQAFCRSCGARVEATAKACPQCGARQQVGKPKSKVTAALLAFFLGFIGAHRLYLGQWFGIFYIFFGGIAWLVSWVEAIVFLATDREKWDQKYGNVVGGGAGFFVALGFLLIVVVGILAAIAVPAYNDYLQRARVGQAIDAAQPAIDGVEAFAGREKFFPDSNAEAGVRDDLSSEMLASATISENGVITITLAASSDLLAGKTLLWVPTLRGDAVHWDCSGGSLEKQYRPSSCRNGEYSGQQAAANRQWVIAEDKITRVSVPTHWKRYPDLNEIAVIEYANLPRDQYFIVVSEPKSDFTDNMDVYSYNELLLENFRASLDNLQMKYLGELTVNEMRGLSYELRGEVDDFKVAYLMVALEGKDHYHQLVFWSKASRWNSSLKIFEQVLSTFSERSPEPALE